MVWVLEYNKTFYGYKRLTLYEAELKAEAAGL